MTPSCGYRIFKADPRVGLWAQAAHSAALQVANDPTIRAANLRHGETWFVGVDALPSAPDGSIAGIPLAGPWADAGAQADLWHPAQLSIVYPGYPQQGVDEADANHRYRITRFAAHVDGVLPIGPQRRRYLREPHAFILGLPLNVSNAAPLTVWPESQKIIGETLRTFIADKPAADVDLTEIYQAARRRCFEQIEPVQLIASPGEAILLHRHLLHGVAPWTENAFAPPEGRMIAYFRPCFSAAQWLAPS